MTQVATIETEEAALFRKLSQVVEEENPELMDEDEFEMLGALIDRLPEDESEWEEPLNIEHIERHARHLRHWVSMFKEEERRTNDFIESETERFEAWRARELKRPMNAMRWHLFILKRLLLIADLRKIKTPHGDLSFTPTLKNQVSVLDAEALIADLKAKEMPELIRVTEEPKVREIKAHFKNTGEIFEGTELGVGGGKFKVDIPDLEVIVRENGDIEDKPKKAEA